MLYSMYYVYHVQHLRLVCWLVLSGFYCNGLLQYLSCISYKSHVNVFLYEKLPGVAGSVTQ